MTFCHMIMHAAHHKEHISLTTQTISDEKDEPFFNITLSKNGKPGLSSIATLEILELIPERSH